MAKDKQYVAYYLIKDDLKGYDPDFAEWLEKQGEGQDDLALQMWADELSYLFEGMDGIFDCLMAVEKKLGYDYDEVYGEEG